jgi:hypothetical protein
VERSVIPIPEEVGFRLYPEAANNYVEIRRAAGAGGVRLRILSAFRSEEAQRRIRERNQNPNAVAKRISAHTYGLAVDLRLSMDAFVVSEATTRPLTNLIRMYRSPVYKWMFIHAGFYGWYPYKMEPWHWEYNPPGFDLRYEAEGRKQDKSKRDADSEPAENRSLSNHFMPDASRVPI